MLRIACGVALAASLLVACGGSSEGSPSPSPSPTPSPSPSPVPATPVGTPSGAPSSAVIGPAGGTLVSPDGRLAIGVPAGAVASDTTFSIQPITITAPGGLGAAYRLGPEGTAFAKPVQLTLTYGDSDLQGTGPEELGLAYQGTDRAWRRVNGGALDTAARTLGVPAVHFSDWSLVPGHLLAPRKATVRVGRQVAFRIEVCRQVVLAPPDPVVPIPTVSLLYECGPISEPMPPVTWEVDGVAGGGAGSGTIQGDNVGATYTAPAQKPQPATVAVSARYRVGTMAFIMVAHVTVEGPAAYQGTFSLRGMFNGTGTVEFAQDFEDATTVSYLGTVTFDLQSIDDASAVCVPTPSTHTSPTATLAIDKVRSTYLWWYSAIWPSTQACTDKVTGDSYTLQLPAWVTFELYDSTCTFPGAQPIADPAVLQGTFVGNGCRDLPTTGTWTFSRSGAAVAADAADP